jgi:hypothetical protein
MTVAAGLIAEFADIDLEGCDPCGVKRKEADSIELCFEWGAARCFSEQLQLLS